MLVLEEILLKEMSRHQMDAAVAWVDEDKKRYKALWELALRNEDPISRRAVWALDIHFTQYPHMFTLDVGSLLHVLKQPCHPAMLRHLTKMLSLLSEFPEEHSSELFDIGIAFTNNPVLPVAIRVHAMELAGRIAIPYPELQAELKSVLQARLAEGSAGFKSRANAWLKRI